jgi:hypothetical protein
MDEMLLARPVTVLWSGAVISCVRVEPLSVEMLRARVEMAVARAVPATSRAVAGAAVPMPT